MSVLIVANVVSGAVIAGYYRIGILKSIGFTPGQVIAAYTGQVTVPALVGCLCGVALGNLLALPLLHKTADVYAVGQLGVPLWVNLAVPLAMCGLVGLAAVLPALRAGRLSATQALAAGRAPRTGRGYLAHRLLGRLVLPRPVTIGLASPFARPARMAATLAAVLLGVTAVTFAVGLVTSLRRAVADLNLTKTEQVQVYYNGPGPSGLKPAGRSSGDFRRAPARDRRGPPFSARNRALRVRGRQSIRQGVRTRAADPGHGVRRGRPLDRLRDVQRPLVHGVRSGSRAQTLPDESTPPSVTPSRSPASAATRSRSGSSARCSTRTTTA